MGVKKMVKTKKSTIDVNGSTVQIPTYKFRQEYLAWKTKCDKITSETMASTGSKYADKNRQTYPRSLYLQLKNHVNKYLRPNSSNTGNDGVYLLLEKINDLVTKTKLFTKDNLEDFNEFLDILDDIEDDPKLNPRNTLFTRPAGWKKGKRLPKDNKTRAVNEITITDDAPQKIYGHYRDNYFEDKYGLPEKKKWWSTAENTANPPLAQAIFGNGELIQRGLKSIIELAIEEITGTPISKIELKIQRNAGSLARIPSVRKQVFALLKRSDLFTAGKPKLKQMATILQGMDFVVGTKSFGARAAKPQKIIQYVANLPDFPNQVERFSLKPFGEGSMASLIMEVVGKKTYKLKNGNYLDIKGRTEVPKQEVKKSWMEQLWR